MTEKIRQTLEIMRKKGFITHEFESASQARDFILQRIGTGRSVGFGGSVTAEELGLYDALLEAGNKCHFHWKCTPETRAETLESARRADFYIMSSNAVSEDGALLNIDGTGNRVSSFIYGPDVIFIVLGKNKFSGSREEAFERVKKTACPLNARRLKLNTPCAVTGICTDCSSPQRMCNYTVWTERPRKSCEVHICAVSEDLGY